MLYRVPLVFAPQKEGGFTVTSPALPELVTEGNTLAEAFANVQDALAAVIELYEDEGRQLPSGVALPANGQVIWSDALVQTP
jgi:antitoxin HicB